jgi:hypothetical protein
MLAQSLDHPFSIQSIILFNAVFCDLGSHFEALESVFLIFFLRTNVIKLTVMPQITYIGSQKQ